MALQFDALEQGGRVGGTGERDVLVSLGEALQVAVGRLGEVEHEPVAEAATGEDALEECGIVGGLGAAQVGIAVGEQGTLLLLFVGKFAVSEVILGLQAGQQAAKEQQEGGEFLQVHRHRAPIASTWGEASRIIPAAEDFAATLRGWGSGGDGSPPGGPAFLRKIKCGPAWFWVFR
jgi:hypothetical protein